MNQNQTIRLSLYIDPDLDAHITTLQKAMGEEEFFPSGMSRNAFVKLLISTGAERLTHIVRELQEI
jgi:hypothetical protein